MNHCISKIHYKVFIILRWIFFEHQLILVLILNSTNSNIAYERVVGACVHHDTYSRAKDCHALFGHISRGIMQNMLILAIKTVINHTFIHCFFKHPHVIFTILFFFFSLLLIFRDWGWENLTTAIGGLNKFWIFNKFSSLEWNAKTTRTLRPHFFSNSTILKYRSQ